MITGIVFLADPSWFHGAAHVHWPEPTFRNFVAVALLALLASRPHAHAHKEARRPKKTDGLTIYGIAGAIRAPGGRSQCRATATGQNEARLALLTGSPRAWRS